MSERNVETESIPAHDTSTVSLTMYITPVFKITRPSTKMLELNVSFMSFGHQV